MRWNNNRQIGQNYRVMIRLMFAVAIIAAVIMAIFDDHPDPDPTILQSRTTHLKRSLNQNLDHDQYIKIDVSERRILLKTSAQNLTDQQLKSQLDQLTNQISTLQKAAQTHLPIYVQNQHGQIIAQIKTDHRGWYRSQKGLKVKAVFGTQ